MSLNMILWGAIVFYVLGSIPTSVLLSKLIGWKDPREEGSGSIGFSNVLRTSDNKLFPLLVLILDMSKGFLAGWAGKYFASGLEVIYFAAVLLGNMFALWPKGDGKGIAVILGKLVSMNPWSVLLMPVWFVISKLSYPVIGSLVVIGAYVGLSMGSSYMWTWPLLLLSIYKHKGNIMRLMQGKENKL